MSRVNMDDNVLHYPRIACGLKLNSMWTVAADNFVVDEDMPPLLFLDNAGAIDVLLPAATEARKGLTFIIFNVSSNTITVKSSGDAAFTTAISLATNEGTIVTCTGSSTAALGWRGMATALST